MPVPKGVARPLLRGDTGATSRDPWSPVESTVLYDGRLRVKPAFGFDVIWVMSGGDNNPINVLANLRGPILPRYS